MGQENNSGLMGGGNTAAGPGKISVGSYSPLTYLSTGQSNVNYTVKLDKEASKYMMGGQLANQALSTISNSVIAGFNWGLQGDALDAQKEVAKEYYQTQETIAGYQQKVAFRQLDVQETAIFVQQDMHRAQVEHEQRMMKLEGNTQVRLAKVVEGEKSARARLYVMKDAFMGNPQIPMLA